MKDERATVLVVDDEPELREIFALWLSREGYHVVTAANGADALKLVTADGIDALISDIRMPIMDGVALVRRIYELQLVLPSIIFVSGFGDVSVRELYSLGVEAMITKPLVRKDLLRALSSSLCQREELWLTPAEGPVADVVTASYRRLEDALAYGEFGIGRGGVCVRSTRAFPEDTLVDLAIEFVEDGRMLRGQGCVRWSSLKDQRIGVEFLYLAPSCRDWLIPRMAGRALCPFIPNCAGIP
jgi:CheY-like chemotaxis protein